MQNQTYQLPHTAQIALNDMTACGITLTVQHDSVLTPFGPKLKPIIYPEGAQFLPRHVPLIHRYKEHFVKYIESLGRVNQGFQEIKETRFDIWGNEVTPTGGERTIEPGRGESFTVAQEEYLKTIFKVEGCWPTRAKTEANEKLKKNIFAQLNALGPNRSSWDGVRIKAQKLTRGVRR